MLKKRFFVLSILLYFFSLQSNGQTSLDANVADTAIVLGQATTLQIKGKLPLKEYKSLFQIDSLPHFIIIKQRVLDSLVQGNEMRIHKEFTITSFDSGRWQIPSIYTTAKSSTPIFILVEYSDSFDVSNPFHDVKEIITEEDAEEKGWAFYLPYLIASLIVVVFLIWYFFKTKKPNMKTGPVLSPYEKAAAAISVLQFQPNDAAEFYRHLQKILLTYLNERMNAAPPLATKQDAIHFIRNLKMDDSLQAKCIDILYKAEGIKFAKQEAAKQESEEIAAQLLSNLQSMEEQIKFPYQTQAQK